MIRESEHKNYVTDEYNRFRVLEGNREVRNKRVKKIISSIDNVGYIPAPIIVNEKYEVIDGAGRLEACIRKNIPVTYEVIPGLGIKECISMNINQENWAIKDYIASFAQLGDESYVNLQNLINEFNRIPLRVIAGIAREKIDLNVSQIKNGEFICTQENYENARNTLMYISKFSNLVRDLGKAEYWLFALGFCYATPEVDNEMLYNKMLNYQGRFIKAIDTKGIFEQIEKAYNFSTPKGKKVYIYALYQTYQDNAYPWYRSKYMKK
jgi:hypothetical protein